MTHLTTLKAPLTSRPFCDLVRELMQAGVANHRTNLTLISNATHIKYHTLRRFYTTPDSDMHSKNLQAIYEFLTAKSLTAGL